MKADSLIIDVRRQLPWHKRYFSTSTHTKINGRHSNNQHAHIIAVVVVEK